jgi:hypothetical protein
MDDMAVFLVIMIVAVMDRRRVAARNSLLVLAKYPACETATVATAADATRGFEILVMISRCAVGPGRWQGSRLSSYDGANSSNIVQNESPMKWERLRQRCCK